MVKTRKKSYEVHKVNADSKPSMLSLASKKKSSANVFKYPNFRRTLNLSAVADNEDTEREVSAAAMRAVTPVISLAKSALAGLTATGANKGGRRTRTKRRRHKKRTRSTKKR